MRVALRDVKCVSGPHVISPLGAPLMGIRTFLPEFGWYWLSLNASIHVDMPVKIDWETTAVFINKAAQVQWRAGVRLSMPRSSLVLADHDLWYVRAGHGWLSIPEGRVELCPGTCVWLRPGYDYEAGQDPDNPICHDFVQFDLIDTSTRKRRSFDAPMPPHVLTPASQHVIAAAVERIVELTGTLIQQLRNGYRSTPFDPYPGANSIAQSMLKSVLMDLDAASGWQPAPGHHTAAMAQRRMMQYAASHIYENPGDAPSISELAAELGYSLPRFSQVFRKVVGKSPKAYAIDARLNRAKLLLSSTDLTAKEIARLLGYKDVKFFSRQFKQKVGVTLTEFRHSLR